MVYSGYRHRDAAAICDRCGFKMHLSDLRKEWTGLKVCSECYERRHPQDFVRAVPDRMSVPEPRPEAADVFLAVGDVTAADL